LVGSVSAGCAEAAVVAAARRVLRDDRPHLFDVEVSNEKAHRAGLVCGGTIAMFVETLADRKLPDTLLHERPVAVVMNLEDGRNAIARYGRATRSWVPCVRPPPQNRQRT
jgi:xanthine/CO dehydrogenase XdhC/CoxF family maturation factor